MIDKKLKCVLLSWAILIFCGLFVPATASAQTPGEQALNTCLFPFRKMFAFGPKRACISATQCGNDQQCVRGYCKMKPGFSYDSDRKSTSSRKAPSEQESVAPSNLTTEEECNVDRRCRIDRLRRKNQARRYQTMLAEEQRAIEYQDTVEQRKLDAKPRTAKPLAAEFYVSFGFGLAGSYMINDHVRLEGTLTYIDAWVDAETTSMGQTTFSNGYISGWNPGGSITYLMRTSWWTPYLALGVVVHSGTYSSFGGFDGFDFDFGADTDTQSILHLAEGRFGFDAQLKFGARARLGILYRYPVYALAKFSPGNYDTASTDVLEAWIKSRRRIAPEFSIGWSF